MMKNEKCLGKRILTDQFLSILLGVSVRVTETGLTKLPGIFISRLVPGGLAESTGLLSVNDEVLEVNGIEVAGKTLDQVTDMMIANSSNLIITVGFLQIYAVCTQLNKLWFFDGVGLLNVARRPSDNKRVAN